jgi:hypothetical protein
LRWCVAMSDHTVSTPLLWPLLAGRFLSQWKRLVCLDGCCCASLDEGAAGNGDPKHWPDAAAAAAAVTFLVAFLHSREPGSGGGGGGGPPPTLRGCDGVGRGGLGMHVAVLAERTEWRAGRGGGGGGGMRPTAFAPATTHSEAAEITVVTVSPGAEALSETAVSGLASTLSAATSKHAGGAADAAVGAGMAAAADTTGKGVVSGAKLHGVGISPSAAGSIIGGSGGGAPATDPEEQLDALSRSWQWGRLGGGVTKYAGLPKWRPGARKARTAFAGRRGF